MSYRREFLKRAGVLAAVPLAEIRLLGQGASSIERTVGPTPKLKWLFAEDQIHVTLDGLRILKSCSPGYQENGSWKLATNLSLRQEGSPYSDKCGRGSALSIGCKLGALDGTLILVNYDNGKLGYRLDLTNSTSGPIILDSYSPLMTQHGRGSIELTGHPAEWRVYVDSGACGGKCASYGLNENEGKNTAGAVSVLWSPGGDQSLAIGQVEVERSWTTIVYEYGGKGINNGKYRWAQDKSVDFRLEQDAIGYELSPGEDFHLDLCMLAFHKDPFQSLVAFRDAMVIFNGVRKFTNDDAWVGWMTWYNQESHLRGEMGALGDTSASQVVTLEQSRFIADSGLRHYGVRHIAIDDGYQRNLHLGAWLEATPMFPGGMKGLSDGLHKLDMIPGVWLAPFVATEDSPVYREHPNWFVRYAFDWYMHDAPVRAYEFDPTAPGALDWLINVFRTFKQWGYWFYKNDFSGGLISSHGKQYYNRKQTGLMRWRWTWRKIKESLGGDGACSIQLCGANNIGGLGIVDTVRTGSDIGPCVSDSQWRTISEDTATTGINRWWQNKHFFISDPDNLEVAEYKNYRAYADRVDFESKWALSFDEARVRAVLVVAVGGNILLGDRLTLIEPERIEIIKKTLPLYGESAIPLDMFEQTVPTLWWHHITKPWGSWEVISVVNFGESSLVKEIPLERMKIHPEQPVIAWELWSETQYTNIQQGILRVVVKPHSVKTIRITPIRKDRTALVGTSFHITMGALEVTDVAPSGRSGLIARVSRPATEEGRCSFWSAQKQAVVTLPVKTGPNGADLRIN